MANYLDNLDVIDATGNPSNVLLQDRGAMSLINGLIPKVNMLMTSYKLLDITTVEHSDLGAAFAANEDDYDGFIIPSGTYEMSSSYTASKPIIIIGFDNPTINAADNVQIILPYQSYVDGMSFEFEYGDRILTNGHPVLEIRGSKSIIKNVSVNYCNGGLLVYNATDVLIDNCNVSHSRSEVIAGIWIGGASQETHIINCNSSDNILDGINISSDGVTIENCICNRNGVLPTTFGALGACGIYGQEPSNSFITIRNCKCEGNGECGIDCVFHIANIDGCFCSGNGLSGISLSGGYLSKINNNTCINNGINPTTANPTAWGHSGIDIKGGNIVLINNNMCSDTNNTRTQQHGINVLSGTLSNAVICDNNCIYNQSDGIHNVSDGVNGCIVKNNIVLN